MRNTLLVIARLPGVAQVAVIGVPNEAWGEAVHAVIVPEPGSRLHAAEISASLRKELAGYKCPKTIEIRTEPLPTTGNKTSKLRLRQDYAAAAREHAK